MNRTVNLQYPGCIDQARIMHELLHTLGKLFFILLETKILSNQRKLYFSRIYVFGNLNKIFILTYSSET